MQSAVIILGAGKPYQGDEHAALRNASGHARVLDWLLRAVEPLKAAVHFVGGYKVESIQQGYPGLKYWINADWETSGAAYSLLEVDVEAEEKCLVFYSDILIRKSLVQELRRCEADITVAVDSHWRTRYAGRTRMDIERCEKTCLHGQTVMRLGTDIPPDLASAEFVGCVQFGRQALQYLHESKVDLRQHLRSGNLSDLIEAMRLSGFSVQSVDVHGQWAELNEPQDLAHFVLGTKAQTLRRLRRMVKCSRIEDQVSFTVDQWLQNKSLVLSAIESQFTSQRLVIRSSALSEDGFANSNAGAYSSLLNIEGANLQALSNAIEHVIASYTDTNPENQVLVQPMLENVTASGVVFTRSLSDGAPYYVINYDDVSGSTESITSGSSQEHKTLVVRRDACSSSANIPVRVRDLLPALREIESLLNYDSLDVEFAITPQGGLHILQVRPIAVEHSVHDGGDEQIFALLNEAEERFIKLQQPSPFVVGRKALFGVMPDWNPAEIIGTKPGALATSLYKHLIMDDTWAAQRAEYGYRDVRPQPLLVSFAGHPYVDIRASFNSFVPAALNESLAERLVDFYLSWLESNPHLHDKVEFDVVPTCFALDFDHWRIRLIEQGGFSESEVDQLRDSLREISAQALKRNDQDYAHIAKLELRFEQIRQQALPPLDKVWMLLHDCRLHGTLPFAHLARSAFVAITLLRSAVNARILSEAELNDFLNSIRTVSHQLSDDAQACASGTLSWDMFVQQYGHLRPGTYDINSLSYRADAERYLRPIVNNSTPHTSLDHASGQLWNGARQRFCDALVSEGLNCTVDELERFLRQAIEGRESAKFAFSRNLSLALDELAEWGNTLGVPREALAHVELDAILSLRSGVLDEVETEKWLSQLAREGLSRYLQIKSIELPPLLCKVEDFKVFLYPSTQPNFVGSGRVQGSCVDLSLERDELNLEGKIALIPQADPGYDWLFSRKIAGLITMYGGANSHMAIRAAEFGLPAALGVGEALFRKLASAKELDLNAGNRTIRVIH